MNPIKATAWNFWYTLSDTETKTVYQLAIAKTWQILKQAVQLTILLALFITTVAVWLFAVSFQTGRSLRAWLETEQPSLSQVLSGAQSVLLTSFNSTWKWLQAQLQARLGIEVKLPPLPEFKSLESKTTAPEKSPTTATQTKP